MLKKNILRIFFVIVIILNLNCFGYKKHVKNGFAMGADLTIIIFHNDSKKAQNILNKSFELADSLEKKVSSKIDNSIITLLNQKKDMIIDDPFTLELIKDSIYFAEMTEGDFEPTLFELLNLWGIEKGIKIIPEGDNIKKALNKKGYKNILINENRVILKNGVSIDLGGIAAGKIIDRISLFLQSQGVKDFLINSSGDLVIKGKFQGMRDWLIGITNPFDPSKLIGEISLTDCSITTSGDYEKYFIGEDGIRYHHIFDPKTGYPTKHNLHSFTVISDSSVKCDALSTGIFVMGVEKGLKFLEKIGKTEGIFVINDENNYSIIFSSGIDAKKNNNDMWDFVLKTKK